MKRRVLAVLLCIAIAAGMAFAGGSQEKAVATTADGKQIVKWLIWEQPEAGYQQIADAFMAENPDIEVQIENVPFDRYEDKVRTMLASGEPYDLIQMNDDYVRMYVNRGLLQPLDPYLESAGIDPSIYYSNLWDFAVFDGSKYGFVPATKVRVIYYNKEMVEAAGLPDLPHTWADPNWTWDTFLDYAQKLTIRDGSKTLQWGFLGISGFEQAWVASANGNGMFTPDGMTFTGGDEGARKALQFGHDLIHEYKVHPLYGDTDTDTKMQNLFISEQAAMFYGVSSAAATFREQADFVWDIAPVPAMDADHLDWVNNEPSFVVFSIPKTSPNPDGAARLIAFMGTELPQKIFADNNNVPANMDIAANYFNDDSQLPEHKNVVLDGVNYAKSVGFGNHTDEGRMFYRVWLQNIWIDDMTVDEAMDAAEAEIQPVLSAE